jgi:hypothetical protein
MIGGQEPEDEGSDASPAQAGGIKPRRPWFQAADEEAKRKQSDGQRGHTPGRWIGRGDGGCKTDVDC